MTDLAPKEGAMEYRCWSRIGIQGDGSCPRLAAHIHCRNCPEYARQGRELLDREAPAGYIDEWTAILAPAKEAIPAGSISVVVFRIGNEWLAMKTEYFLEIVSVRTIHTIPGVGGEALMGLVNVNGELLLCVSLEALLGIQSAKDYRRMLVVTFQNQRWVIPVEEILGLDRLFEKDMEDAPVTLAKAATNHAVGLFTCHAHRVALLDGPLLAGALKRSIR